MVYYNIFFIIRIKNKKGKMEDESKKKKSWTPIIS